jgi:hypothetical protein
MGIKRRRGTPEYEAWILTPEYRIFCDKCSRRMTGLKRPDHAAKMRGKNNPNFGGKSTTYKSYLKNSLSHLGSSNSRWRGGVSFEPYCQKFNLPFRKRVRARYSNRCVECKRTPEENGRELDVHHVNFDKQTCCKDGEVITDQKFVALCRSCHSYATHHLEWAIEHYTRIVDEEYGGKSYLTVEEMSLL